MLQLRNAIAVKNSQQDPELGNQMKLGTKRQKPAHFIRKTGNKCLMEIEHDSYWGSCAL